MPVTTNVATGQTVSTTLSTSNAYEASFASTRRDFGQANMRETTRTDPLRTNYRLVYNAGISKESYFRSHQATAGTTVRSGTADSLDTLGNNRNGLWRILQTDSAGNTPGAVEQASVLWAKTQAYKGMISTSSHMEGKPNTDDKTAAKVNPLVPSFRQDGINYAFQFHYNPGSLAMDYGGAPPVDVSLAASGGENFNSYGSGAGSGTISLNLILNRINDMKYFDPNTGKLKAGLTPAVFAGRPPDSRELADIYNRGTMYDMEFLFRTLLGYEYNSFLGRGMSWDKKTADLGWLGGKPVEIHLGKSLRYLGRVVSVSISHVLFTERMVPTFSEVGIVIQRLPDVTGDSRTTTPAVTPAPAAFNQTITTINGIANTVTTNEFGQTVNTPIFDGTFG